MFRRRVLLPFLDRGYRWLARPVIFRRSPQAAHEAAMRLLARLDEREWAQRGLGLAQRLAFEASPVKIGGVILPYPLMLAAGFVKGRGFESEAAALAAVERSENIIPGWRSMPRLVGAVEFGSFTRWPRMGNPGIVMWRDMATRSTQNYVGLRNPGVRAAAAFLSARREYLPPVWGLNIASSPGVSDPLQERSEALESITIFLECGLKPSWLTLNISCPNTEDDPGSRQTETRTRLLCESVISALHSSDVPLWVKVSPALSDGQYKMLAGVFVSEGVKAIIATNTLAAPKPDAPDLMAGVGGGRLYEHALKAAVTLMDEISRRGYDLDVIGCGGVLDGAGLEAYTRLGVKAVQYWSALIYRGPLAGAVIFEEARRGTNGD